MKLFNSTERTVRCDECDARVSPGGIHDCGGPELPAFDEIRLPALGARKPNADQQFGDYGELREWDE